MDETRIWQTIDAERAATADLLAGLTDVEWTYPSLCAGWTVREVAAHLSLAHRIGVGGALKAFARARGSFNRMVDQTVRAEARRPTAEIVANVRSAVGHHKLAPGQTLKNALMDSMVHAQDIAIPLGLDLPMRATATTLAATRRWDTRRTWLSQVFRRLPLEDYRLTATDTDWTRGQGPEVAGPIGALLLLLTGREAALEHLAGDGAHALRSAVSGSV